MALSTMSSMRVIMSALDSGTKRYRFMSCLRPL